MWRQLLVWWELWPGPPFHPPCRRGASPANPARYHAGSQHVTGRGAPRWGLRASGIEIGDVPLRGRPASPAGADLWTALIHYNMSVIVNAEGPPKPPHRHREGSGLAALRLEEKSGRAPT